ncbi:hypothetical protein OPV22_028130 [Ensete ventricosum]|uniref:Uncharacterized protein n=1 Tax=Ensete ventricosum TaxID=4639 RepID=A0AAV8PXC8_ENSVE|nr:hypothetical protein OPV22_028130 [Ensete ventricosum]
MGTGRGRERAGSLHSAHLQILSKGEGRRLQVWCSLCRLLVSFASDMERFRISFVAPFLFLELEWSDVPLLVMLLGSISLTGSASALGVPDLCCRDPLAIVEMLWF